MKKLILLLFACGCLALHGFGETIDSYRPGPKKILKFGWDSTGNVKYIREHIAEMEVQAPFDGIGIIPFANTTKDGKSAQCNYTEIFKNWKWEKAWFQPMVDDLKATKFKRYTDNFLQTAIAIDKFDWFDDAAWDNICNNYAVIAWAAKASGCKGMVLDLEHYKYQVFQYVDNPDQSFAATKAKARERGHQLIRAITAEYPDITLFAFMFLSTNHREAKANDIDSALRLSHYGLLPAFINGLYDDLPESAKVVDGCEGQGYASRNYSDYLSLRKTFQTEFPLLLDRQNVKKFAAQTSLATSLYLDVYLNKTGTSIKEANVRPVDLLARNLAAAAECADEYFWIYCEKNKWWPINYGKWQEDAFKKAGGGYLWTEVCPGINGAIEFARDPQQYALQLYRSGKLKKNLVQNSSFEAVDIPKSGAKPSGKIPSWESLSKGEGEPTHENVWRSVKATGTLRLDPSVGLAGSASARTDRATFGIFTQKIAVKPETYFMAAACAKTQGGVSPELQIKWIDADKKNCPSITTAIGIFTEDAGKGWKRAVIVSKVPPHAAYAEITLKATGPDAPDATCWFDQIEFYDLLDGVF